jgi:putative ABC transport system permease protein
MIYTRIMRNEVARKRGALTVVFAFIFLAALLLAAGASLIVELAGALDGLFAAARTPHLVQMHAGELDRERIEAWGRGHELVEETQVAEMITVDGSALLLPGADAPQADSIMDTSFVVQNKRFDFLLDGSNEVARVSRGEIGVPVYYAEEKGVRPGDRLTVIAGDRSRAYTVGPIIRDSQMNPAIVHSKRFLVHPRDYRELRTWFPETEYLVEFRLTDPAHTDTVAKHYEAAGLPNRGPMVDQQLFRLLNGVSDGIVAVVVIVLSLLLMLIAVLCLRFTILATVEEDYRQIGVMKAVGMPGRRIRQLYLAKYLAIGGGAALAGWIASRPLAGVLTAGIMRYIGPAAPGPATLLVPAAAAAAVFALVYLSAIVILRRFNRVSAVEALRAGVEAETPRPGRAVPLRRAKALDMNVFLGARDALLRIRLFGLLVLVFFFAAAITLVPLHFLSTMRAESFITYMGIGASDIRIDLRENGAAAQQAEAALDRIASDRDVQRVAVYTTTRATLLLEDGERESFAVETGDFTVFPLEYLRGRAPRGASEIALSHLNSSELGTGIGDTLRLETNGVTREVRVVGVYQDITDGGRTAKAAFAHEEGAVVARTVSIDLEPGVPVAEKVREYADALGHARVTHLEEYLRQTLGSTISGLLSVSIGALLLGGAVSVLITSLFFRMLVARDARRIAIMQSIGVSQRGIRIQYLTTALLLLLLGIAAGTLFSNTLGPRLVSFLWSFMGAPRIEFVIEPVAAYLLVPSLLVLVVGVTTLINVSAIRNGRITAALAG